MYKCGAGVFKHNCALCCADGECLLIWGTCQWREKVDVCPHCGKQPNDEEEKE
jgi:hypothetical protein